MGFEYGYSRDYPEALVLWEAQFGDFANVAQAVIDQFVSAGEDKWGLLSGLAAIAPTVMKARVLEHSSARIERFLQLAARDNFRDLPAIQRGPVLPPAAPTGFTPLAQAAGKVHAQKHVATSRCVLTHRGLHSAAFPSGSSGHGCD